MLTSAAEHTMLVTEMGVEVLTARKPDLSGRGLSRCRAPRTGRRRQRSSAGKSR